LPQNCPSATLCGYLAILPNKITLPNHPSRAIKKELRNNINTKHASMSNKLLIPLIIILSLITIGVVSLTQLNKVPGKFAMNNNQSSEIISSIKTQVGSSSSSVQILNSSSVVSSIQKVVESVKAESQAVIPNTTECNLPESENLVKTEVGCFVLYFSMSDGYTFKEDIIKDYPQNAEKITERLLYKSDYNIKLLRALGIDYYLRVKNKVESKNPQYLMQIVDKEGGKFKIEILVDDIDYLKLNPNLPTSIYVNRFNAKYTISEQPNGEWNYQFVDFVRNPDGSRINE
jgi:hypothetical protein